MVRNRKELSVDVREALVSLYYSGIRQVEISRRLNIPRTTITGVIKRFRRRGNVENIQRLGAPSKFSRRDTREILRSVKINRKISLQFSTRIKTLQFQNVPFKGNYTVRAITGVLSENA